MSEVWNRQLRQPRALRTESIGVVPLVAGQPPVVIVPGGEFAAALRNRPWPGHKIRATSAVAACACASVLSSGPSSSGPRAGLRKHLAAAPRRWMVLARPWRNWPSLMQQYWPLSKFSHCLDFRRDDVETPWARLGLSVPSTSV